MEVVGAGAGVGAGLVVAEAGALVLVTGPLRGDRVECGVELGGLTVPD